MLVIFEENEQATRSRPSWKRTGQFLLSRAVSMGRCNSCSKSSCRSLRGWFRSRARIQTKHCPV